MRSYSGVYQKGNSMRFFVVILLLATCGGCVTTTTASIGSDNITDRHAPISGRIEVTMLNNR